MPGFQVKKEISPDDFLADLSDAAYRAALKHGFTGSFLDLRLEIQRALRDMIRKDMFVVDLCGLYSICNEGTKAEPWTKEALKSYPAAKD